MILRTRMWRTRQEYNIDNSVIGIIKKLYTDDRAYVKQGNRLSSSIYSAIIQL